MTKPRRVNITGEHAAVRSLSQKEKHKLGFKGFPHLVKRTVREKSNPAYSTAMSMAHLLFPSHFPRLVASGTDKRSVFLEAVPLNRTSRKGINGFYEDMAADKNFLKHRSKVKEEINVLAREFSKAGILINRFETNVGRTPKGNLVFFEVGAINVRELKKYVEALPNGHKKKQAAELLGYLEKIAEGNQIIHVHSKDKN